MKKRRVSRKEAARRRKIAAGVRRYWGRVKRLRKKAGVTLPRARRLYSAGLGRPKRERLRKIHRLKITGVLWPQKGDQAPQFVMSLEENQRRRIDPRLPKVARKYVGDVQYVFEGTDDEEIYKDQIEWEAKGPGEFWGEYWIAMKDWLRLLIEQFEPESMSKTEDGSPPAAGSAEILKITMGRAESGGVPV